MDTRVRSAVRPTAALLSSVLLAGAAAPALADVGAPPSATDGPVILKAVDPASPGGATEPIATEPTEQDKAKARAQALLTQGIDRLQTFEYQAALDFFVGAYNEYQSPKILLNIGATLLELGRTADAANTFQLYIEDPETKVDRLAEVKARLLALDEQLSVTRITVAPTNVEVSVDGGPWVPVGVRMLNRLTPGIHLLRGRKDGHVTAEVSVNAFEGESREVTLTLEVAPPTTPNGGGDTGGGGTGLIEPGTDPATPPAPVEVAVAANPNAKADGDKPPEEVTAWLVTGAKAERGGVQTATVVDVKEFLPSETEEDEPYFQVIEKSTPSRLGVGVQARIDATGQGAAFGGGVKVDLTPHWQLEASMMFSSLPGFYLGARYRVFTGMFRPYVAAGEPFFIATDDMRTSDEQNYLRLGLRVGGGLEIGINDHLSVTGEVAYEHFFDVSEATVESDTGSRQVTFDKNLFVPLVGLEARL